MKNDYDETIFGTYKGDIGDWMEWYHGYLHDAFNKKDVEYFKKNFMPNKKVQFLSDFHVLFIGITFSCNIARFAV